MSRLLGKVSDLTLRPLRGLRGEINLPLRWGVSGLTGWTPYRILGPRGPPTCGPSRARATGYSRRSTSGCRGPTDSPPSPSAVRPAAGALVGALL